METNVIVTYSEKENRLTHTNDEIITVVDLDKETISYANENPRKLDYSDIYIFKNILDNVLDRQTLDKLIPELVKMDFFKTIYLPSSIGSFTTPYNKYIGYFFIFSTMFAPYQMIDFEKTNKPDYSIILQNAFNETNSVLKYDLKKLLRIILVLPGLIFTPFVLATAILALKNMS